MSRASKEGPPLSPSCCSLSLPLRINLIWGHLLFRTLTPYGQPPTQSTPSHFHENLKSSHINYWWSSLLTGCPGLCSPLELKIVTYSSITNNLTPTSHAVKDPSRNCRGLYSQTVFFSENRKKKWEKMREKCNKQQLDLVAIKNCCAPGATLLPPIMKQTSSSFPGGGARVGGAPGEWRMPWGCESCEETFRLNGEARKNWLTEGLFLVFHELKTLSSSNSQKTLPVCGDWQPVHSSKRSTKSAQTAQRQPYRNTKQDFCVLTRQLRLSLYAAYKGEREIH